MERGDTIFNYDWKDNPVNAIKNIEVNNKLGINVLYDQEGCYKTAYFFNNRGLDIKADDLLHEIYYKNGEPVCYVDLMGNVFDKEGYFIFVL